MARLSRPGWLWLDTKMVYPRTVTHPSTNRAQRRATELYVDQDQRVTIKPNSHHLPNTNLASKENCNDLEEPVKRCRSRWIPRVEHIVSAIIKADNLVVLLLCSRRSAELTMRLHEMPQLPSVPSLFQCLHFSSPHILSRCQSTFSFVFLCFSHLRCRSGVSCVVVDYLPSFPRDRTM